MATVFLSYDHDDVDRAAPIAAALEKAGHSVWWDRHIHGGAQYNDEIEAAVQEADAVVVLWSEGSVRSTWVRDEAAEGRDQNKLVPVLLDAVKPPMGFRQFQTIDLSRSGRAPSASSTRQILDAIAKVGGISQAHSPAPMAPVAKSSMRFPRALGRRAGLSIAALVLVAVAALIVWNWRGQQTLPVVAVAVSDPGPSSTALARDLFVKLGTLEHVGASKWVLADFQSAKSSPDLVFRVAETGSAAQLQASLVLVDGKGDSLLWSREFAQADGSEADLRQQLSLAAGVALVCALEAREDGELGPDLFKRYLASCADAAVGSDMDPDKTVAAMRSIIAERPHFKPAWGQLLTAQSSVLALAELGIPDDAVTPRRTLIEDIRKARHVAPDLPEIEFAEIQLLSPLDFSGRLERVARAKAQAPDKAGVWGFEASELEGVGRMIEAVASARRAADLEPLSPVAANQFIMTMAYSGQIEAAKKELALVEQKWAGTGALRDVQWAFHLRFGDPAIAEARQGQTANLYLRARREPTAENIAAMVAELELASATNSGELGYAIQAFGEFNMTDEAFLWLHRAEPTQLAGLSYLLFRPAQDDIRRDPRFMAVAKRIGLLSYWLKSGKWPDFCYEPDLPYSCRKEAAKLAA